MIYFSDIKSTILLFLNIYIISWTSTTVQHQRQNHGSRDPSPKPVRAVSSFSFYYHGSRDPSPKPVRAVSSFSFSYHRSRDLSPKPVRAVSSFSLYSWKYCHLILRTYHLKIIWENLFLPVFCHKFGPYFFSLFLNSQTRGGLLNIPYGYKEHQSFLRGKRCL